MLDFKDVLDYCQAEAIAGKFSPTEDSVYRSICRSYSKTFHAPLYEVYSLPVAEVVLAVYEDQLENVDFSKFENLEQVHEEILEIINPDYRKEKESKLEKDIEMYEREEEERIKSGKAVHPSLAKKSSEKTLSENPVDNNQNLPTGGMINLDYLSDEES